MEDIFVVRDLETLKALADVRRVELLRLLQRPRTTRQAAERLGETPNAIYYHITELEKYGLIRVVKTAMKGHLQEKYYQAVARFYTPADDLFTGEYDQVKQTSYDLIQSMFAAATYAMKRVMDDAGMQHQVLEVSFFNQKRLHLPAERLNDFRDELAALVDRFMSQEDPDLPPSALLTLTFFPVVPEEKDGRQRKNLKG